MSQNRVTGLASAFDAPAVPSSTVPSAVSALASRFDAPPSATSTDPQVSDKVSGIASRFGATVADVGATGRKPGTPAKPVSQEPKKSDPVVEERPDFGEITKRFASGAAGDKEDDQGEEAPNMFAAAASAWGKREEEARTQSGRNVSAFKREFDGAKKAVGGAKKEEHVPASVGEVVEEKAAGVGNIASRFEMGVKGNEKEDGGEGLGTRFDSATKIFAAEDKVPEEGEGGSIKSRFADAAKLFGGGSGK